MSRALFNAWSALERARLSRIIVRLEPREVSDGPDWFPIVVAAWDDEGQRAYGLWSKLGDRVHDLCPGASAVLLERGRQPRAGTVAVCACDPWDEAHCAACGGTGWVWIDAAAVVA